jgi:serine/threonine-protein kinase
MNLQIGDQFDHYQIKAHMAQGGMSDIYRAVDLLNGQEVALKIPNKYMIGDPAQFERFQREMEVMKTLRHPVLQHGLEAGQYNRTPYLVTELVQGQSLRDYLNEKGVLPADAAIALMLKIGAGISYCHANHVVHRDLKPENILLQHDGQPVILDFGLALTKDARRVTYANLTSSAGTPDYMAPEQIEGQRGDERTDLYALGTMLYEMLAGKLPFTGADNLSVMAQHLKGPVPRLDRENPAISPQLAAVVTRALQRSPADRYDSVAAFMHALEHLEEADVTILERATGAATILPFWKTQAFRLAVTILIVMVAIVLVGLLAQNVGGPVR